jgi:hypothetical protein
VEERWQDLFGKYDGMTWGLKGLLSEISQTDEYKTFIIFADGT